MVEVSMKLEAVLGLPGVLEVLNGEVADQMITLTVMRNPAESLLSAVWEKCLPRP
jgi:hypothetical protein